MGFSPLCAFTVSCLLTRTPLQSLIRHSAGRVIEILLQKWLKTAQKNNLLGHEEMICHKNLNGSFNCYYCTSNIAPHLPPLPHLHFHLLLLPHLRPSPRHSTFLFAYNYCSVRTSSLRMMTAFVNACVFWKSNRLVMNLFQAVAKPCSRLFKPCSDAAFIELHNSPLKSLHQEPQCRCLSDSTLTIF